MGVEVAASPLAANTCKKPKKFTAPILSSPRDKLLRLPEISKHQVKPQPIEVVKENPFHMPPDQGVFAMREGEKKIKQELKEKMKNLKIHEKNVEKRKNFKSLLSEDLDDVEFYEKMKKKDSEKILVNKHAQDRHFTKENLHDFIGKKREMFLVQYALGVKRQEMQKLEEIAQAEEQTLLDDEKALEEDAAKFDAFLKENDKNSVEAIKRAEMETKGKLEKIQEIKKLNVNIMNVRSEMSKNEEQLKDLQRYRKFLDKLTPSDASKKELETSKKAAAVSKALQKSLPQQKSTKLNKISKNRQVNNAEKEEPEEEEAEGSEEVQEDIEELWSDVGEEPLLYFNSPQQLLDIFSELEENNLSLIQNCQETEETLEDLKQKIVETESKMEAETQSLKQQIEFLNAAIVKEEEKAKALEERSKLFSSGLVGAESQERLLEELNHKVKEVYRRCIGDSDANLNTLQMLTNIENKLENLFEDIELMPPDKVEQAEKLKDKERRQRLREEKMDAQRILQEERVQRALERARAPVKKKVIF
ncbi:Coiled-coil domain-containing protein 38 [Clydaea vesicula]|uniref:Coiled-coil domain-containing protein 38 n=1 Tax=Clydaea vesicula TaxID=447962 RepID=A0AAD5Y1S8_9FUNG|nr:Coiled-coil domain-containing protein 38 [Clydaea vesicula]